MFTYFAHSGSISDPKTFFAQENYIICRGATDSVELEQLFDFYNQHIATSPQLYLRQSKQWQKNQYSEFGGITNAFLQPHCYQQDIQGEFADKILKLTANPKIQQALNQISGIGPYSLAQTMFFDQKTTRSHQDWIYLDSKPNGYIIAAWIALEDIPTEGIRFFVYPESQNFQPQTSYNQQGKGLATFDNFLREIDGVLATGQYEMYAPSIQKGDIFFWGSKIIHGSIAGIDKSLRRRSLAAHFLPDGFKFGNLVQEVEIDFAEKYNLKYRNLDYLNREFYKHNSEKKKNSVSKKITNLLQKITNIF